MASFRSSSAARTATGSGVPPELVLRASPPLAARTLSRRGYLRSVLGLWDVAREDFRAALAIASTAGDRDLQSNLLRMLATNERLAGNMQAARGSIATPATIGKTKAMIRKACQAQIEDCGFGIVAVLSNCPVGWGMTPVESVQHLTEVAET